MKQKFVIEGLAGRKILNGEIKVNGAKNAVLPLLAATILLDKPVEFSNVPKIEDVARILELLKILGAEFEWTGERTLKVDGSKVSGQILDNENAKRMRASILLVGPLLARFGKVFFPHPGGCVIGERPIDLFIEGFKKMGAIISEKDGLYEISTPDGLAGTDFFFRVPSVTGTETLLLAAIGAKGRTILKNAALEPEVVCLAKFLNSHGAKILGAGSSEIIIEGGCELKESASSADKIFPIIPDRIEAGSFLILGALAATHLKIINCQPAHLDSLIETLRFAGVTIEIGSDWLVVRNNAKAANETLRTVNIKTKEYPGFPTDLQAPMAVFLTQVYGESLIHETIFEGRLNYIADLEKMGADIKMWDAHRALVKGPITLKGKELDGPDIRAGLAYILAAIVAEGESTINNAYFIDRGYERIEERLQKIGVKIKRVDA
ncbi:MAG: UDP-N-acetylglucosamine 1-carboxyvinyltransferase [Parcubacteria group bacterium GW2011_GWB1_44_7]|nr:MAG: UDP-N-acetylglucosamine 1-carboxyvinyltransferase [Parcubacteria group bacterium GW2011_GWB1_44_7]